MAIDVLPEGADEQGRATAAVGVGRAPHVPAAPALGAFAGKRREHVAAPPRAQLDPADAVVGADAVPRNADR